MLSEMNEVSQKDLIQIFQTFYKDKSKTNGNTSGNFRVKSYETRLLSEVPVGFLSQHIILTVKFEGVEGVEYTTEFFVKKVVQSLKDYVEEYGVFKKEIGVFQKIFPKLTIFSSSKWAPLCYLSKENVMVFENLQNFGFQMVIDSNGVFDINHQLVAVGSLAAMHASSIIFEKRYNAIKDEDWFYLLDENVYPSDPKAMKSITHNYVVNTLCEIVTKIPKYKDSINEVLPNFRQLMQRMKDFVKPSRNYRNVFCHGDLWSNNIMFKYANFSNGININDRIPVEAILIDFQLARYAPPALDLMVMLTITSNSDYRKQYLAKLCDAYYAHLTCELKNHSIDIESEIPRQQFDDSCRFYQVVGLMESCLFSHMTILPKHLLSTATNDSDRNTFMTKSKTEICLEAFNTVESYRHRMSDMLIELIDEYVFPVLLNQ